MNDITKTESPIQSSIQSLIQSLIDPYHGQSFQTAKNLIEIDQNTSEITLNLGYPAEKSNIPERISEALEQKIGPHDFKIKIKTKISSHQVQPGLSGIPNIKNIIAVASGKGGVGKSTTAVNLALALSYEGAKTGLLDADIYGPSVPSMLGSSEAPTSDDQKSINPIIQHGLQTMSIGYLVDTETPMIWRGPMVSTALKQLLNDCRWDNLDYLIIDLPPGTGDIQLTLSQKIPTSGAVIITTPQDLALMDVRRAIKMFDKVNIKSLGVIENMSSHLCSNCGHIENIFGSGGGEKISEECQIRLLGHLPLDIKIRQAVDGGIPSLIENPESPLSKIYRNLALKLSAELSLRPKNYSLKFPRVVIQNN